MGIRENLFMYNQKTINTNYNRLDDTVRDGRLGMRLSDGCIRLAKESAKWIWDNVGFGSAIHIE